MNIHESGEDYLETILKLQQEHGRVRSIDGSSTVKTHKSSKSGLVAAFFVSSP